MPLRVASTEGRQPATTLLAYSKFSCLRARSRDGGLSRTVRKLEHSSAILSIPARSGMCGACSTWSYLRRALGSDGSSVTHITRSATSMPNW
jgi:hypothetical protein